MPNICCRGLAQTIVEIFLRDENDKIECVHKGIFPLQLKDAISLGQKSVGRTSWLKVTSPNLAPIPSIVSNNTGNGISTY